MKPFYVCPECLGTGWVEDLPCPRILDEYDCDEDEEVIDLIARRGDNLDEHGI